MPGVFVPHHQILTADGTTPTAWLLIAHGIFGSGANWRTFARNLMRTRPDWGVVLVDLRMHGHSLDAPGPHSVGAAARDLHALAEQLASGGRPVDAVLGHSFGGKVALLYRAMATETLRQTWVIDASPSPRPGAMDDPDDTVTRVLRMLERLPSSFSSRQEFVAAVKERGFSTQLGHFLGMNLARSGPVYVSRIDTHAMTALLADYYRLDAWPAVVAGPGSLHVVIAGRSSSISQTDRERLVKLAEIDSSIHVQIFPDSGHWVHIDAAQPLLELVTEHLPIQLT